MRDILDRLSAHRGYCVDAEDGRYHTKCPTCGVELTIEIDGVNFCVRVGNIKAPHDESKHTTPEYDSPLGGFNDW